MPASCSRTRSPPPPSLTLPCLPMLGFPRGRACSRVPSCGSGFGTPSALATGTGFDLREMHARPRHRRPNSKTRSRPQRHHTTETQTQTKRKPRLKAQGRNGSAIVRWRARSHAHARTRPCQHTRRRTTRRSQSRRRSGRGEPSPGADVGGPCRQVAGANMLLQPVGAAAIAGHQSLIEAQHRPIPAQLADPTWADPAWHVACCTPTDFCTTNYSMAAREVEAHSAQRFESSRIVS